MEKKYTIFNFLILFSIVWRVCVDNWTRRMQCNWPIKLLQVFLCFLYLLLSYFDLCDPYQFIRRKKVSSKMKFEQVSTLFIKNCACFKTFVLWGTCPMRTKMMATIKLNISNILILHRSIQWVQSLQWLWYGLNDLHLHFWQRQETFLCAKVFEPSLLFNWY
jgi:hypothetical protein